MPYEVVNVSAWHVMAIENAGADPKLWLTPPSHSQDKDRSAWWLFKEAKHGVQPRADGQGEDAYRRTDDYAEKISCELAKLLGVPTADVQLAARDTDEGVISHNVAPKDWELQPGDTVLSEYPGYVSCDGKPKMKLRPGHSLANIKQLLSPMLGPLDTSVDKWPAFDVFAGYLVLDAWIANADRHAINWGVLQSANAERLAKSFDHGSALGSGLTDENRLRFLRAGIGSWCTKGVAQRFEEGRAVTLVDLALAAVAGGSERASEWVTRLAALERQQWQSVLTEMSALSVVERKFIDELLFENQRRLCHDQ